MCEERDNILDHMSQQEFQVVGARHVCGVRHQGGDMRIEAMSRNSLCAQSQ